MNQITHDRMVLIFNEWADRYAKNPEKFAPLLGEDGNPVNTYGEDCASYFESISNEMDALGLLPTYTAYINLGDDYEYPEIKEIME